MYQIYPICLKISTSDFARILPKSRMRFFVKNLSEEKPPAKLVE